MKFYQPTLLGLFPLFAALGALAGGISGAVKARSANKQRERDIESRNKRRTFAAFTGDMPQGDAPAKQSMLGNVLGSSLGGLQMGGGIDSLASGIGGTTINAATTPSTGMGNIYDTTANNAFGKIRPKVGMNEMWDPNYKAYLG